jgi:methylated-DNA-protein-cysteine methyltransferase related protein
MTSAGQGSARARSGGELLSIRATVRRIPRGKVATYGQVAAAAGYPGHARQTVWALRLPGPPVPWHRVVGAGGKIRLKGVEAFEQTILLQSEGVDVIAGRVSMAAFGYDFGGNHPRGPATFDRSS